MVGIRAEVADERAHDEGNGGEKRDEDLGQGQTGHEEDRQEH